MVALGVNSTVFGKLIHRTRHAQMAMATHAPLDLSRSVLWPRVAVSIQLAAAMPASSAQYLHLTDLFSVVTSVIGCGDTATRTSVRTLVVTGLQSALAAGVPSNAAAIQSALSALSDQASDAIFGLSSVGSEIDSWDVLSAGAKLVNTLVDAVDCCAPNSGQPVSEQTNARSSQSLSQMLQTPGGLDGLP